MESFQRKALGIIPSSTQKIASVPLAGRNRFYTQRPLAGCKFSNAPQTTLRAGRGEKFSPPRRPKPPFEGWVISLSTNARKDVVFWYQTRKRRPCLPKAARGRAGSDPVAGGRCGGMEGWAATATGSETGGKKGAVDFHCPAWAGFSPRGASSAFPAHRLE